MRPIPYQTLLDAMTRIRAGEKFDAVHRSINLDKDRLRYQLRAAFADFDALMQSHSGHKKPRQVAIPAKSDPPPVIKPPAKQAKPQKHRTGFNFQHTKPRKSTDEEPRRQLEALDGREPPYVRTMADMSTEEVAELQAKAEVVLNGHSGLNLRPFSPEILGEL
jgi:hypothetical protein